MIASAVRHENKDKWWAAEAPIAAAKQQLKPIS